MIKKRLLSMLVLLAAVVSGAVAQTETLLTTITATGTDSYSETTSGVVSVTATNVSEYSADYGWLWYESGSLSVTALEGYTITRCVFRQNAKTPIEDTEAPFEIHSGNFGGFIEDKTGLMDGVTSIEVYGPAAPSGYTVTLAEGTEDASNWKAKVGNGELQALPLTGLSGGETITVTYSGDKKVKSVKAVKKAAANPKLGDLFYSDGTFSTELEAGKTPIGVIAYLDKEGTDDDGITEKSNGAGHGLVLCLKNAASNVEWSTNISSQAYTGNAFVTDVAGLKRSEGVSGYSATAALATDATIYPAAAAAKNYTGLTAPTSTTGWFLPSAQQLVKMIEGLGGLDDGAPYIESYFDNNHEGADKWENAIKKAGNGKYDSMTSDYLLYWSSSENSVGYAVFLAVDAKSTGGTNGFSWFNYGKDQKADIILVRPVLAF